MDNNLLFSAKPLHEYSGPHKGDNNRRSDTNVRSAIGSIQNLLFDPDAALKIFPLLLEHITEITESDCSVILTCDNECLKPISANGLSENGNTLHCLHAKKSPPFISAKTVAHWINTGVMPMRPVFFNELASSHYATLLLKPEQLSAIMILPIINQDHLQGICILAKKTGAYSSVLMRRLMPLLGSVVCALQSADSVKGNLYSLNQKISDNRFLNALLATSPSAILVVAENNDIVVSNHAAHGMFAHGNTPSNLSPLSFSSEDDHSVSIYDFIPQFDDLFQWSNQRYRYGNDNLVSPPRVWENQAANRLDGKPFLVNISVFRYTHNINRYTVLQIQDVTAVSEKAEEYQRASQQLTALTHLVPVGIIHVDANWNCVYANDKWYEFSGAQ